MLVQAIMTSPPITVPASCSVAEAAKRMLDNKISGLPVVDANGALVGIVSEGDFLRRSELNTERKRSWLLEWLTSSGKIADEYVRAHGRRVEEVMTVPVSAIAPTASIADAVSLMERQDVKRLPVVADGRLVGIVARSDLLRALSQALPAAAVSAGDAQIQAAIDAELARQSWSRNGFIHCRVANGVAELSGTIFDERERLAAKVAVENVAGVTSIKDQLVWVDPYYGVAIPPPETEARLG
ncbi:CBS domain-containing protein [Rhizobium ruizarguesonis]|jgi:CBS domain-containing protein|uniref:CBS domain-containing protein n=1 Tax=Rhizobium ruizarguesonis TaxID=2081791 RepID=A0AAE8QH18_9HYPH|nr:CBS domain-containing protein [Rhizobium ruizarguesonis]MBY5833303.1 CBS domain-containing protein [Rhizobium leguminosarum]NKL16584.1 CBS domain-containing protein [Rhizobium leguminosarum bv. viciae]QIO45603.1 CBS domain-containing protein [Rhizobium leguminosarum bv. trifolii]QJS30068.1 CBS domain-containing protein [Rhizobium leguminosarum bv. trifolii TA1]MBY5848301.1 CBS domain-containing protein [Rhizobium leguminosarum]